MSTLTLELSDVDVQRIADAVAARLAPKKGPASVPDAARELGISTRGAYRLIASGRLRTTKVGSRTLVLRESIEQLLKTTGGVDE